MKHRQSERAGISRVAFSRRPDYRVISFPSFSGFSMFSEMNHVRGVLFKWTSFLSNASSHVREQQLSWSGNTALRGLLFYKFLMSGVVLLLHFVLGHISVEFWHGLGAFALHYEWVFTEITTVAMQPKRTQVCFIFSFLSLCSGDCWWLSFFVVHWLFFLCVCVCELFYAHPCPWLVDFDLTRFWAEITLGVNRKVWTKITKLCNEFVKEQLILSWLWKTPT